MASHARLSSLSADEYLEAEQRSEVRHEYVAGSLFAMVGASRTHNLIVVNLTTALRTHLRGGPCRVFASDMKVRVNKTGAFYYPDLAVTCDPTDAAPLYLTRPVLIIEVLSPATEIIDRREKLMAYREIETLGEYVLVAQDRRQVEIYRRAAGDAWEVDTYADSEEIRLNAVELSIAMTAIYEDVVA